MVDKSENLIRNNQQLQCSMQLFSERLHHRTVKSESSIEFHDFLPCLLKSSCIPDHIFVYFPCNEVCTTITVHWWPPIKIRFLSASISFGIHLSLQEKHFPVSKCSHQCPQIESTRIVPSQWNRATSSSFQSFLASNPFNEPC